MRSQTIWVVILSRLQKVFRWLAGWIIAIFTLFVLTLGLGLARTVGSVRPGSFAERHALATMAIGWLLVAVATVIIVGTMTKEDGTPSRWVKAIPGCLGLATFNGLIMLSDGHILNNPAKPIAHKDAMIMTLFFFASAVLSSFMLKRRHLKVIDRVALLVFAFSLAWAFTDNSGAKMELVVGFSSLVMAMAYHFVQDRQHSANRTGGFVDSSSR